MGLVEKNLTFLLIVASVKFKDNYVLVTEKWAASSLWFARIKDKN